MEYNNLNKKFDQEKLTNKEESLLDCLSMFNLSGISKKRSYIKDYIIYESLNETKMKNFKVKAEILFNESEEKNTCYFMLGCKDKENIYSEINGLDKNEIELSLKAMNIICDELEAKFEVINETYIINKIVLEIKVEKINSKLELRMGMFGEECSGKSTLIGVLVNGNLDDGNGSARSNIFRFQHEHNTGKTSNLSHYLIGFDCDKKLINCDKFDIKINGEIQDSKSRILWEEIISKSKKIMSFYDLGGASKFSLNIVSSQYLDFFVLVINPILGFTELTKIYLSLAIQLKLSIITVITASDLVKPETLDIFISDYKNLIKNFNLRKISLVVTSNKDIELFSRNIEEPIHPIFVISCKTGFGLDYLIDFFSLLTPKKKSIFNLYKSIGLDTTINMKESKFDIHEHFVSLDKKIIVAGFVSKGKLKVGEKYHLGPDKLGKFQIVEIEGLHCRKVPSIEALEGYFVTVSIKKENLTNDNVRKGMVLISLNSKPYSCKIFECEISSIIDNEPKKISYKSEPLVNIKNIRQCCRIKKPKDLNGSNIEESIIFSAKKQKPISIPQSSDNDIDEDFVDKLSYNKNGETTMNSSMNKSMLKKFSDVYQEKDDEKKTKQKMIGISKEYKDVLDDDYSSLSKNIDSFEISKNVKTKLTLEFKNFPEYIFEGDQIIINEKNFKALGTISRICQFT